MLWRHNVFLLLQSKDGKTPLHMTAIHGRFSRSQAIIENGGYLEKFSLADFISHAGL